MRKYFINSREVKKEEWQKAYQDNLSASVVLRIPSRPILPETEKDGVSVSPERIRAIRESYYKEKEDRLKNLYQL